MGHKSIEATDHARQLGFSVLNAEEAEAPPGTVCSIRFDKMTYHFKSGDLLIGFLWGWEARDELTPLDDEW